MIDLLPSSYTTSRSAVDGSWSLQSLQGGGYAHGVLCIVNEPRGGPSIPP